MRALIDGDIIIYKCGFAAEQRYYEIYEKDNVEFGWIAKYKYKKDVDKYLEMYGEEKFHVEKTAEAEPISHAIHNIDKLIQSILHDTRSSEYQLYLSGEGNYRETVATLLPYKGNRDPTHKPLHYEELKRYLISLGAIVVDGMEADDGMGIEQYTREYARLHPGDTTICTIDKDLDMIPGLHYNWDKIRMYFINEEDGYRNFFRQVLQGDTVDNIPGLYKITEQKATKAIMEPLVYMTKPKEMKAYVEEVYLRHRGLIGTEQMLKLLEEIMKLLWISRTRPNDLEEFI